MFFLRKRINIILSKYKFKMANNTEEFKRPSSDLAAFKKDLKKSKHLVILSGAGISAESGIPTFRGAGGYWRKWQAQNLATPESFSANPSLVWEFYHHRREVVFSKSPNPAHYAVAKIQEKFKKEGKTVDVITQNIDGLHTAAGAKDLVELHGSLFKVRCTSCKEVTENTSSPICEALRGKGEADITAADAQIPISQLPKCLSCGGLLRPHVVWFGESLDQKVLQKTSASVKKCDMLLVIGTSAVVYPAAGFAPDAAARGVPVAEFNMEDTMQTGLFKYHFTGPAGEWLPKALDC